MNVTLIGANVGARRVSVSSVGEVLRRRVKATKVLAC
jgi:hypothetical protein